MDKIKYYYDICCRCHGKPVRIREVTGREYHGRIVNVDEQYVYLEPVGPQSRFGGFGYGYHGGHMGPGHHGHHGHHGGHGHHGYQHPHHGHGHVFPVALAAIGGFALGTAFFI